VDTDLHQSWLIWARIYKNNLTDSITTELKHRRAKEQTVAAIQEGKGENG
jgi:hypothetical protein